MFPERSVAAPLLLGDRLLNEARRVLARTLALNGEASIDPHGLKLIKKSLILVENKRKDVETGDPLGLLKAREYSNYAKAVLRLVKNFSGGDVLRVPDLAHGSPTDDGQTEPAPTTSPTQEHVYQFLDRVQKTSSDHMHKISTIGDNVIRRLSPHTPERAPTLPPSLKPQDDLASDLMRELLINERYTTTINTSPSPSQENVPTSPLAPPDKLLYDTDGSPQCVNVISTPSSLTQGHVLALPPAPDNLASYPMPELLTNDLQCITVVNTPPSPSQEHNPTSPLSPPDKPLSIHVQESSTDHKLCPNATSTQSVSARGHVPTSQTSPLRILKPPDKLNPTLSCWIKNMKKLSGLIDRLEKLASCAHAEHRSQLLKQVEAFRTMSKKQKERFMKFLQLSEEYANKYLLGISDEIQQQSSFLDKLKGRLETAEKLRGEAVELKMLYESRTVVTMDDLRTTALSRPLPEDKALFSEVDSVIAEIRRCYVELDKFWAEEISRAVEALKMRRADPTDFERWEKFHANLKQTIESWEPVQNELPCGDAQNLRLHNVRFSEETDIGEIASSLSSAMGSLEPALLSILSSDSLKCSGLNRSSIEQVYKAFAANRDMCLSLLRQCFDYREKVLACRLPSITSPTSFRTGAPHDLRERTMKLRSEMTGVSQENSISVQGSRKLKDAYNAALSLERKMISGLNALMEELSSWVTVTDGHGLRDDAFLDEVILEQHHELWEKARDALGSALATLKNEPAPRLSRRSAPLVSTQPQSVMKRWMTNLVCCS